ncbi:MAG: flippase [bacterium]|nr:flippase [bacterium]
MFKNSLWNAAGLVVPSLIALPALAVMARVLGVEKFGVFMLVFSALGFAGVFDGGLVRAVIRAVAMNGGDEQLNGRVVGTAGWVVLALGVGVAAAVAATAAPLVSLLKVSAVARADSIIALRVAALVIPVYLLSLVWFAYLEGKQRFARLSLIKSVTGILLTMLPALAVLARPGLDAALAALLVARLATLAAAYRPCRDAIGAAIFRYDRATARDLFRFGGWIAVSNLLAPMMGYADRFLISNVLGAARVAFYAAPAEVAARLSVIPGAVARTIFPLFSQLQESSAEQARRAFRGLLVVCLAVAVPLFLVADWFLDRWLGPPYGEESAIVLRLLLIGFVFNALGQVPYSRIQALGRSRDTAMLHMIELVPYLLLLVLLVRDFGLAGAAAAWTTRVVIDFVVLQLMARRLAD